MTFIHGQSGARRATLLFGSLVVGIAAGCGGGGATAPVDGRVKFSDGSDVSALRGYEVTFVPKGGKASASGTIQADGTFKLSTFGAEDGAVPGEYQVAITPSLSPDPDKPPPKPVIPDKYREPQTSGVTAEVKPGGNKVELNLERRP